MAHVRKEEAKSKGDRLQTILRLVQEHPISRQEVLLDYLRKEGFDVTQATISRDIRELCLVKAATAEGYRYVSSRNESFNPKTQGRFETIFHESVLGVDYAGHVVLVKCYSGMANAGGLLSRQRRSVHGLPSRHGPEHGRRAASGCPAGTRPAPRQAACFPSR